MDDKVQLGALLKDLRRETYSIRNRLQSIVYDTEFVEQFQQFPQIANERCGLWYVKPGQLLDTAYFKSTDGHTGQWRFSYRRLNFNVLPILGEHGGIILVDSTRKGKLMPDALLKTVPMWCAVLNYIMFEGVESELCKDWLVTPREMVSQSEHSEMAKLVPGFAQEVLKLGLISSEALISRLGSRKPLVPTWYYPSKPDKPVKDANVFSVCCLTASKSKTLNWPYSWQYIQGAADDHELWTQDIPGLTPEIFWNDVSSDFAAVDLYGMFVPETELVARITEICEGLSSSPNLDISRLGETGLLVGKIEGDVSYKELQARFSKVDSVVILSQKYSITDVPEEPAVQIISHKVESSKKGSKLLRELLPQILPQLNPSTEKNVMVLCDSGKDISVGVVLCILCQQFDSDWKKSPVHANKDVVKQHLSLILNFHKVNPSRNTLQSVNTYVMGHRH